MVFNNVILRTSTSVKQTLTRAVLMPFVTTPTDPSIAHVNLDIKQMEKTAQVIFILVSGLLPWHQKLCVYFSVTFVCLIHSLLFPSFSLTTHFVCSYKRTSVGLPFSRQLIGIHRANLAYCHWCSTMISDIDECELEAHNCSSNAICNNTKGSYNCTCKPAYEGDGNNCTVNFFRKFVVFADHRKHCRFYFSVIRCSL